MLKLSLANVHEQTRLSEYPESLAVSLEESHVGRHEFQGVKKEWFSFSDFKVQNTGSEPKHVTNIEIYKSPFVFEAETNSDNGTLLKYSRYLRKLKNKSPFYFKWGVWKGVGASRSLCDILETQGQLEANLRGAKWRAPYDINVLRLGLTSGQMVDKVALKVVAPEQTAFFTTLCNISMDSVLYRLTPNGEYNWQQNLRMPLKIVPIIGLSLRSKENYGVVKLWLGSSESAQSEPQQILHFLLKLATLIPEKYLEIIASGIYIRKDGESYRVFDTDKNEQN